MANFIRDEINESMVALQIKPNGSLSNNYLILLYIPQISLFDGR